MSERVPVRKGAKFVDANEIPSIKKKPDRRKICRGRRGEKKRR